MDDPAWHAWYDRHAARLLLYARQWLPDRASAEDAVQGGFVKVWRRCRSGEMPDVPLLYAAVRSEALDLLKSQARRRAREDRVADGSDRDWWEDQNAPTPRAIGTTRLIGIIVLALSLLLLALAGFPKAW
jgi:DNA-directed RNA polymerase specialized sigma24 family protein